MAVGVAQTGRRYALLHARRRRRPFDATLGYPGEGHGRRERVGTVGFGTVNVTAWSSFVGAGLLKGSRAHVWAVQESKLVTRAETKKAREFCDKSVWGAELGLAVRTEANGRSCGTGVLWNRAVVSGTGGDGGPRALASKRLSKRSLLVAGMPFQVASVYGDVYSRAVTERLLEGLLAEVGDQELWVIAGDFNMTPQEMVEFLGERSRLDVVYPKGYTCYPSNGDPSCIDYFLVSPMVRRLVTGCHTLEGTSIATHRPVVLDVKVDGVVEALTKWCRSAPPPQEGLRRIVGPIREVGDVIGRRLEEAQWEAVFAGDESKELLQCEVDEVYGLWLAAVVEELRECTTLELKGAGAGYEFQEFCPLSQAREAGRKQQGVCGLLELQEWCDRRLAEAAAMAKRGDWGQWSSRTAVSLRQRLTRIEAPLGHLAAMLAEPWLFGEQFLRDERGRLRGTVETTVAEAKKEGIARWRRSINDSAAQGTRQAFRFIRGDDDPGREAGHLGVAQVLRQHCGQLSELWQCSEEAGGAAAGAFGAQARARFKGHRTKVVEPGVWRKAAAAFPASTSCPDGLHVRLFGLLSELRLRQLGIMAAAWIARGVWPSSEQEVMTVLIPKAAGGERPIALFRSVVRLVAKVYAREADEWLSTRAPEYLNTARGRRVGDAMWRQQIRAALQVEAGGWAAELGEDITKAFEHVDRALLVEEAACLGYPPSALVAALDA